MVFCTNCGKELSAGAKFCNSCGKEQILSENSCSKCGKILEENEKFCSGCGTQVEHKTEPKAEPQVQAETEQEQKEQFTKEGRKIITGGPKPEQNPPVPPPIQAQKKKKSGCRGCLIAFLIFLLVVIIIGAAGVFILNKITDGELLKKYPNIDWTGAKGMRDIISHHYFEIDADVIFEVCQNKIRPLRDTVELMIDQLR